MNKKILFIVIVLLSVILINGCQTTEQLNDNTQNNQHMEDISETASKPTTPTTKSLLVGEEGKLFVEGSEEIILAKTKDVLEEMTKAANAGDTTGYKAPYYREDAFFVDANTKVLVLENTVTATKVRILEGIQKDKVGWVPYEWVVK